MARPQAKFGLATMCIGAGQGIATIFEAVPLSRDSAQIILF